MRWKFLWWKSAKNPYHQTDKGFQRTSNDVSVRLMWKTGHIAWKRWRTPKNLMGRSRRSNPCQWAINEHRNRFRRALSEWRRSRPRLSSRYASTFWCWKNSIGASYLPAKQEGIDRNLLFTLQRAVVCTVRKTANSPAFASQLWYAVWLSPYLLWPCTHF